MVPEPYPHLPRVCLGARLSIRELSPVVTLEIQKSIEDYLMSIERTNEGPGECPGACAVLDAPRSGSATSEQRASQAQGMSILELPWNAESGRAPLPFQKRLGRGRGELGGFLGKERVTERPGARRRLQRGHGAARGSWGAASVSRASKGLFLEGVGPGYSLDILWIFFGQTSGAASWSPRFANVRQLEF